MIAYNGWKNWETWVVNLWLTNDQELYDLTLAINYETKYFSESEAITYVATEIRESTMAIWDTMTGNVDHWALGLFTDLIQGSMALVDWDEIARSVREDWLSRGSHFTEEEG